MTKRQKKKATFKPFEHDNLELKNELVELARNIISDESLEKRLAAILIYWNIAEYLAENLLDNLNHIIRENSYKSFAWILFLESASWGNNRTLGQLIIEIKKFSFPDKDWIVNCLQKIVESRNKIFHNFAKSNLETIGNLLNDDLPAIWNECEDLILRINTIYAWLQKTLQI